MSKIQRLEAFMHQRIRLYLANGGNLIRGGFEDERGCCPIAACIRIDRPIKMSYATALSAEFGEPISLDEMFTITNGFDGVHETDYFYYEEIQLWNLGARLFQEYMA